MPEQNQQQFGPRTDASESFRTVPNHSEAFRNVPNPAETFRTFRNHSERGENHTISVREAARLFEAAGVARTERSIVNWCQPNKMGVARLDCYFDPNERKYFITPESIQLAISEEQAKATRDNGLQAGSGTASNVPKDSERPPSREEKRASNEDVAPDELRALKQEMIDLKITNKGKDYFIEQLQKEREGFNLERQGYVDKLMEFNRQVGELETRLLQLEDPSTRRLKVQSLDETESNSVEAKQIHPGPNTA